MLTAIEVPEIHKINWKELTQKYWFHFFYQNYLRDFENWCALGQTREYIFSNSSPKCAQRNGVWIKTDVFTIRFIVYLSKQIHHVFFKVRNQSFWTNTCIVRAGIRSHLHCHVICSFVIYFTFSFAIERCEVKKFIKFAKVNETYSNSTFNRYRSKQFSYLFYFVKMTYLWL